MPSVLMVDDDPDIRDVWEEFLRRSGFDTASAPDAQSALLLMAASTPTVVLCDVHLPAGRDGLWLADQIRTLYPTTAMVLATGDDTVPPTHSLRKGIVAYLVKPFRREDVLRAVEDAVRWSTAEAEKRTAGAPTRITE